MRVERLSLEEVREPKLELALRRWHQLCGNGGLYRREEMGFGPLVGAPEILNGRSAVIATDTDDPQNYVIAFFGDEFNVYGDKNFVARRLCELPDPDLVEVIIKCYAEAIAAREPIAHRISASFDGTTITYDRLILPTINKAGKIDRLVTLSTEVSRAN
ncbi:MAG: hypothetical protein QF491_02325 [Alphaproteobacteria bacterium]|nr:hypothetical protein [Alphaproteobacteria bacterium]